MNFDEMVELHQRDPEMFERRRKELINDAIDRCSGPQQEALRKLQTELDEVRELSPDKFLQICFTLIADGLETQTRLWRQVNENLDRKTTH